MTSYIFFLCLLVSLVFLGPWCRLDYGMYEDAFISMYKCEVAMVIHVRDASKHPNDPSRRRILS